MPIAHCSRKCENVPLERIRPTRGTFLHGKNDKSERSCLGRSPPRDQISHFFPTVPSGNWYSVNWTTVEEDRLLWRRKMQMNVQRQQQTRIWCAYALWWSKQSNCQESQWNHLVMHEPWMLLLWQWDGENFTTNVILTFFASEYFFVFSFLNISPRYLNFT